MRRRGFALAMTLLVAALMAVLLSGAVTSTLFGRQVSERFRARRVAAEAARAGLDTALWHLGRDPGWKEGLAQSLPRSGATFQMQVGPGPAGSLHVVSTGRFGGQAVTSEAYVETGVRGKSKKNQDRPEVLARWGD